jgi:hypothetical protein
LSIEILQMSMKPWILQDEVGRLPVAVDILRFKQVENSNILTKLFDFVLKVVGMTEHSRNACPWYRYVCIVER